MKQLFIFNRHVLLMSKKFKKYKNSMTTMKSSISIVTTLFALIVLVMGTNIQAFSQNTTTTNGPTSNTVQSQILQAVSESSNTTFGGASPELKTLFQNQDINASIIPSINTTTTGEKRNGGVFINTG